ncbi:MAG: MFS transporter [Acidobacteriaceae bacterium]|nr:MFS transporter [Acidobacteriaceae bacterium]MBV9500950.1 MFS transporter [Acidobacteriaceae bacterium]
MEGSTAHSSAVWTSEFESATYRKITWRLIPFLFLCYVFAYVDRVNVGFAKLQMQQDIGFSDAAYGNAAGIFFFGYLFFQVPCNLALQKIGARRWLGPIMIVWGLVSACTMLVKGEVSFCIVRFLLGVVESGFFPGVILFLTFWYPAKYRAKMVSAFMTAVPLSGVIGGPISGWLLDRMSSAGGLRGWQWLFLFEAVPSILAGLTTLLVLQDSPAKAKWLDETERSLLLERLKQDEEHRKSSAGGRTKLSDAFRNPKIWVLCFVYFGVVMGNYGIGFWLPQIFKDTLTKDPFQIGLYTVIPWGAAAIAMVALGHHSDVTGERCWHVALAAIAGAVAFGVSSIPGISGPAVLIALTVATAGIISASSTFWALPTALVTGTAASAGIAWINSIGNLAGYLSPWLVGEIKDMTHSMTPALLTLAAFCLGSAVLTITFFRKRQPA